MNGDKYFQIPSWVMSSGAFFKLTHVQQSLYALFAYHANRFSRKTYSYKISSLALRCEVNRKSVRGAIRNLATKGLIRSLSKNIKVQVEVLFTPPPGLSVQRSYYSDRDISLTSSLNGSSLNCTPHREDGDILPHLGGHITTSRGVFCPILSFEQIKTAVGQWPEQGQKDFATLVSFEDGPGIDPAELYRRLYKELSQKYEST